MGDKAFRVILFYVFLLIFCATAMIALVSIAFPAMLPSVDHSVRDKLMGGLVLEAVASMFAFWKQLTGKTFSDPPDVTGEWEYECIRDDESYKHGGICRIDVKRSTFGWEFNISGKRTWMARFTDGKWEKKEMQAASAWENTWGTFTGTDAMRYAYSVKTGNNLVQGYGWAAIKKDKHGNPNLMEGNFFQLPPHDPFYGFQRYWRLSNAG